jgi:hypothetical protein
VANPVYVSGQVAIGTTPTLIAVPGSSSSMVVTNTGSAAVFLGGANVTTTTGLSVGNGATVAIPVAGGQQASLYGVAAATGNTLSYLFVV